MTNSTSNDLPPCDIRIDKNGTWYFKGAEMIRKEIVQLFYQHLDREDSGRYTIELPNDKCYIDVEDVPFIIECVNCVQQSGKIDSIQLRLNDETQESLNPESLRVAPDNVLYCAVRSNRFEARFSRASYYQLAEFIEHDGENDRYFIELNGNKFYIAAPHSLPGG